MAKSDGCSEELKRKVDEALRQSAVLIEQSAKLFQQTTKLIEQTRASLGKRTSDSRTGFFESLVGIEDSEPGTYSLGVRLRRPF